MSDEIAATPCGGSGEGREPLLETAIVWLLRLREDASAETLAEFEAWRAAGADHAVAWAEATRIWDLAALALLDGEEAP